MGRRGPPRTPTALLKAAGSRLAARRAPLEPQPGRGVPTMPATLGAPARRIWQAIAPVLDTMGVLTTADGASLARYCQTLADWHQLNRVIQRSGFTFKTKTTAGHPTVKTRPEVGIRKGLAADLAKLEAQFGLTPAARASLEVTAIFTPGRKTVPTPTPADPDKPTPAPAPNVIQGKDRFFGGKPA